VLQPVKEALFNAQDAQNKRKQGVKVKSFDLRKQLNDLTSEDTKLTTTDSKLSTTVSSLKGILTGVAGGAQGANTSIGVLETVAAKLGTVEWGSGGKFLGIDTSAQGEAYDEQTTILGLQNTLAQIATAASTDPSAQAATELQLSQQIGLQTQETNALIAAQSSVLTGMLPQLGAALVGTVPQFAAGGPVLDDGLAYVHRGEHVVPQGGTLVMNATGGGQAPNVELHQHLHGSMPALAQFIDQRIQHPSNVRAVSRQLGNRTSMLRGAPGR
jgi:hypothetical protein